MPASRNASAGYDNGNVLARAFHWSGRQTERVFFRIYAGTHAGTLSPGNARFVPLQLETQFLGGRPVLFSLFLTCKLAQFRGRDTREFNKTAAVSSSSNSRIFFCCSEIFQNSSCVRILLPRLYILSVFKFWYIFFFLLFFLEFFILSFCF